MAVDNLPVLVNGVSKTHSDITFVVDTTPIIGLTALNYEDPQTIEGNFSNANKMTSVGFGPVRPTANATFTLEAIEQLQALAANVGGRIQSLPFFQITVVLDNPEGGLFIKHVLKQCRFKGRSFASQADNTQIEETIEIFVADIDYQTL